MKNKIFLSLGFAVLYCLTLALPIERAQAQRTNVRQTWEYRVVMSNLPYGASPTQVAEGLQIQLNQLGAEGWELMWIGQFNTLYVKRPK